MKRMAYLAAVLLVMALVGCKKEPQVKDEPQVQKVSVTGITLNPTARNYGCLIRPVYED